MQTHTHTHTDAHTDSDEYSIVAFCKIGTNAKCNYNKGKFLYILLDFHYFIKLKSNLGREKAYNLQYISLLGQKWSPEVNSSI